MLELVASIHKAWRAKCYIAIKNFDKNHFQHLKALRKKAKDKSVMPATSSDNSPACTI